MFFWGSYNFQMPQLTEHPTRPPLRFPMYVPRCPSAALPCANQTPRSGVLKGDATAPEIQKALQDVCQFPLDITQLACGQKHAVMVVRTDHGEDGHETVFGLGSNHFGQLGSRVATYTTTLANLHVEDIISSSVASVACGARHTLISTSTGCVYACGDNSCGQVGVAGVHIKTLAGQSGNSAYVPSFTQVTSIAHIQKVFANNNASFALDKWGQVYSWGAAQHGHLGHGDNGERLDPVSLKVATQHVTAPQAIQWFTRHRVVVTDIAVGKAHLVCRSNDDVYTCGEAVFGKLGHGDIQPRYEPTRVVFPSRKQTEKLVAIAAGDDHTLILKENPAIGSVLYYFGKLSNGDGQLTPTIITVPSTTVTHVVAGKGTMCACISAEGRLYVWGKHSYTKVFNGTHASAGRSQPTQVEVLSHCRIQGLAVGGTFVMAHASTTSTPSPVHAKADTLCEETSTMKQTPTEHAWDVVVPHDYRCGKQTFNRSSSGDPQEEYEGSVKCFLQQYLGEPLGTVYSTGLPVAPAPTATPVYQFDRIGAHGLQLGQKVRLWMTDVYALGTVTHIQESNRSSPSIEDAVNHCPNNHKGPRRACRIEWERVDWQDEVISLYSVDETLSEDNPNRWQPFWFEKDGTGEYVVPQHT